MVTLIKSISLAENKVLCSILKQRIFKVYRGKCEAKVGRMIDFCSIIPSIISRVLHGCKLCSLSMRVLCIHIVHKKFSIILFRVLDAEIEHVFLG